MSIKIYFITYHFRKLERWSLQLLYCFVYSLLPLTVKVIIIHLHCNFKYSDIEHFQNLLIHKHFFPLKETITKILKSLIKHRDISRCLIAINYSSSALLEITIDFLQNMYLKLYAVTMSWNWNYIFFKFSSTKNNFRKFNKFFSNLR